MTPKSLSQTDAGSVEELIDELKSELLELFDYSDVKGNRTLVRGELVRSLDAARETWRKQGARGWRPPQVRYRGISDLLEKLEGPTRFLNPAFYVEKLTRVGLANRSLEVDGFGLDPAFLARADNFLNFLYERYWRVETQGVDHIPHSGKALLVANHSGTLPFDALMISQAIRREHPAQRQARFLVEDVFMAAPFVAPFLTRLGMVRASRSNARRLLREGALTGVFPEGEKGISKLYKQRYQLQRFGRGGFVRLALQAQAPIIPVAVVGAEEILPMVGKSETVGKLFGLPYFPITPLLPLTGPLGLVPLPTKWFIWFGKPLEITRYGPEAAQDEILVNRLKEETRATIGGMIYDILKTRKSVWAG